MKATFKLLLISGALAVLALGAHGCGKTEEKKAEPAANATAAAPVPVAPKTIVFAVDATYPPMQYLNDKKEVVGFEVDVIKAAAERAGFKAEFRSVPWDGIFGGLDKKDYDAVSASLSITDERKASMDFSEPITAIEQVLLTAKTAKITDLAGLKGKSAGTQEGTISYKLLLAAKGIKAVKGYPDQDAAVAELLKGSIQAVLTGRPAAMQFVAKNPDKLKIAGAVASFDVGVAFRKDDRESVALLNKGLADIKADGTIERLKEKHQLK
jgi:polar amino acid transport system substrate-binding protein